MSAAPLRTGSWDEVAVKAARSAILQIRRGSRGGARALYYSAHSLLRALRSHLRAA